MSGARQTSLRPLRARQRLRRRVGAAILSGGLVMGHGAFANPEDEPMATAGGRYAYAAATTPPAAVVVQVGGYTAPEPDYASAAVATEIASSDERQDPPRRENPVLIPIQGPLKLEGQYLGDLSGAVDGQGKGVVDAARLLDLLKPLLSADSLAQLEARIAGAEQIDMEDLRSAAFSIDFDPFALSFNAYLDPGGRARRAVSFGQTETINPAAFDQPSRFAAGANIAVGQSFSHAADRFAPMQGGVDAFATWGGFGGVTLTTGADYDGASEEKWHRRETRLSKDFFSSAIRLTAGEFSPPVESFQGSRRFLGVSAARAYSTIRPFQNVRPSGRREFTLDRDSTVEVEVNGVVVDRLRLGPGPYSLSDFPYAQGPNTVRLIVEDDAGRNEIAVFDLFGGAALLDTGVVDFGVSAGVLEEGGEFEYGSSPAISAFYRRGMSDVVTAGANAQYYDGRTQAGALVSWGAPFGQLQLSGAASHNAHSGRSGVATAIDFLHQTVLLDEVDTRFIATLQTASRHFQSAFAAVPQNREQWRAAVQGVFRYRQYSLNLGTAYSKGRDTQADVSEWTLAAARSFERFSLNLSLGQRVYSDNQRTENRIGLSLTTRFGGRWSGSARYDNQTELREVSFTRSPNGRLDDVSGSLRIAEDRSQSAIAGDVRYVNNRFDAQILSNRFVANTPGGRTTQESIWRFNTFLGYADGTAAIGRQSIEGFVIASRHPSLRNSSLALTDGGGQAVARAGWFGPALAPINRAYGVNRFVVAVDPLPSGYDIGTGVLSTFPSYGSGYHMVVGSDASRTVIGVLVGPAGPMPLVSGTIEALDARAAKEPKLFFTNRGGRFVGDGMAPGRYRITVQGVAIGEFVVPEDQEGVVNVGEIHTRPQ
jgi:outer membrane usher protein